MKTLQGSCRVTDEIGMSKQETQNWTGQRGLTIARLGGQKTSDSFFDPAFLTLGNGINGEWQKREG